MVNPLKKFGQWLFNVEEKKVVQYPIDEELIKKDKQIKAQQQQINARDSQLAKVQAEERRKKEELKEEDYTEKIAQKLEERQKELKKNKFKHTFSLRYFMNKCGMQDKPTKFGKKVDITDKDDKIIFGTFGDLIITDNGYIMITDDKGNILSYARDFSQLIWKPEALKNYMKRERIPLAVDEDLNPVPNLEDADAYDITYNENDKVYEETTEYVRPVKDMLIERDENIRELRSRVQKLELMNVEKDKTINQHLITIKILENRSSNLQTEQVGVIEKYMQFENRMSDMHIQIIKLTELKAMYETMNDKYQDIARRLLEKLDKYGDQNLYERIKAEFQDMGDYWSGILPEKQPMVAPPPQKEREVAQTGQPLSRTPQ